MSAPPGDPPNSGGLRFELGVARVPSKAPANGPAFGPAPAPGRVVASLAPSLAVANTQFARPTRLFTLVFFAIALISCAVMGIFITITLVRRRRRRLQFLQRRRTFGVEFANAPYMSRRHGGEFVLPSREMPPLIEGVLVLHPDGEEQVACPLQNQDGKSTKGDG